MARSVPKCVKLGKCIKDSPRGYLRDQSHMAHLCQVPLSKDRIVRRPSGHHEASRAKLCQFCKLQTVVTGKSMLATKDSIPGCLAPSVRLSSRLQNNSGARHVDPESVRLLWRFSYFDAGGQSVCRQHRCCSAFLWSGVLFFVRVGFGLVFLFDHLVLFFGVSKFLPVCGASLTPAGVVLLLSDVLRLFEVEGLVGVGCSLWIRVPSF
ncbi:hypothetical protein RHMOL_Rhmol10G0223700 [Rhododendron molle]|uniref:Uncharacterized protein n=1 Tax=Rhododendron molle TaxID=49168 RepID=A0ACC0M521_RHOML|nr:hypothetical protein RHMOL_Rhmol10G0223700 [Rhododendron molle]